MPSLIYSMICSFDGYAADESGRFDWAMPDEAVHSFINDLERDAAVHLYGRRMYETMRVWESPDFAEGQPPYIADLAGIWRAADKVVYSTTLAEVDTARTRLEREFDPGAVAEMKHVAPGDVLIGGPTLAGAAIRAGIVDEYHMFVVPTLVGGGLPVFPSGIRIALVLEESRRFDDGFVFLRYSAR